MVAEENPLRSATSRMVTLADGWRLREFSGWRRVFGVAGVDLGDFGGFDSGADMETLNCRLLLADTTGR